MRDPVARVYSRHDLEKPNASGRRPAPQSCYKPVLHASKTAPWAAFRPVQRPTKTRNSFYIRIGEHFRGDFINRNNGTLRNGVRIVCEVHARSNWAYQFNDLYWPYVGTTIIISYPIVRLSVIRAIIFVIENLVLVVVWIGATIVIDKAIVIFRVLVAQIGHIWIAVVIIIARLHVCYGVRLRRMCCCTSCPQSNNDARPNNANASNLGMRSQNKCTILG